VVELRDNIRNNWTMTGQELGRELRQIWQNSRPNSPAPTARNSMDWGARGPLASPTGGAKSHLSRVGGEMHGRADSPMGSRRNEDFATGYSLGLIGGVRAWVSQNEHRLFIFVHLLISIYRWPAAGNHSRNRPAACTVPPTKTLSLSTTTATMRKCVAVPVMSLRSR
jgi:hypothetical protein